MYYSCHCMNHCKRYGEENKKKKSSWKGLVFFIHCQLWHLILIVSEFDWFSNCLSLARVMLLLGHRDFVWYNCHQPKRKILNDWILYLHSQVHFEQWYLNAEGPQHPYSEIKSSSSGWGMSHFLISLWINWKEEHIHPCGHFLWFLSHGLFGLSMFSVVSLVWFGFILFHGRCPSAIHWFASSLSKSSIYFWAQWQLLGWFCIPSKTISCCHDLGERPACAHAALEPST